MQAVQIVWLVSLVAVSARAAPRIILFPALGSPSGVTVSGRVLKHVGSEGHSTLSKNLRRLAASNWEGAPVTVRLDEQTLSVVSGHDGNFEATFSATKAPLAAGVHVVDAHVTGVEAASTTATIVAADAPFFVISDFDDTLAVTNVRETKRLLEATLLKDETTQPVVPGMAALYQCLAREKASAPGFALVSGSPAQYSFRIGQFLSRNGFPPFALYLRDLGPSTLRDYKQPPIRALLASVPNKVVLIGDSGEHDPEVYRQMATEFPGRVAAIFIRNAGQAGDVKRFEGMHLFETPAQAAQLAQRLGLVSAACVAQAFDADGGVR